VSQAEIISITTRRNALRLGAATVATIITPAFAAPRPSSITKLHAALVAACREQDRVGATGDSLPPGITAESLAYSDRMDVACDAWWKVAKQLPHAPARTPAELRLKADALRIVLEQTVCVDIGQTIDDLPECGEIEDVLAWSLARDIQNFVGAA
jgi:hypothetical protein